MELSFEPRYNIAYLRFHEKTTEVDTIPMSDQVNFDPAQDETVDWIELLNANELIQDEDRGESDRYQRRWR